MRDVRGGETAPIQQRDAFQLEVQQEEHQFVFKEPLPNRFVKQKGCARLVHSPSCIPLIAGEKKCPILWITKTCPIL